MSIGNVLKFPSNAQRSNPQTWQRSFPGNPPVKTDWILDVMEDLIAFAVNSELPEVDAALTIAKSKVEYALNVNNS